MMNNLPVRTVGHLFDDVLWIDWKGKAIRVRLIADNLEEATLQSLEGQTLVEGRLTYERSSDRGHPTRVLYFVGGDQKVVVSESHLKTT